MQNRSTNRTEETSHRSPKKKRRRKYAPGASPGVHCGGSGQLCHQQDENVTATDLAAKDRFKILVPETENPKTSNPEKDDYSEHPIHRGADHRLQIGGNSFDIFDSIPPDQSASLKRHSG